MKKLLPLALLALIACTPAEQNSARKAVDVAKFAADTACILAHAFLPTEQAVAKACAIEPALFDMVHQVLSSPTGQAAKTGVCK